MFGSAGSKSAQRKRLANVKTGNGITSNSSGVAVKANNGIVANSSGTFVIPSLYADLHTSCGGI